MLSFTLQHVIEQFDFKTFSRGKNYLDQGRIQVFEENAQKGYIYARVHGSGSKVYKVKVSETTSGLATSCSCPVGYNCKHAVAVALHWLKLGTVVAEPLETAPLFTGTPVAMDNKKAQLKKWLETLPPNSRSQPPLMPVPGKHQLLYFLKVTPSGKARITIRKAYLKKNGEWSQITRYLPSMYELSYHRPGHLQPIDTVILQLIVNHQNNDEFFLSGKKGYLVLTEMLRSNRLLLDESYQYLDQGAEQALSLCWKHTDEQHLRLSIELSESEQWQLIVTDPPYYLDENRGLIGLLQSHIDADRLHHLLQFPEVHQDELRVVAPSLRLNFPKDQLPLPEEPDMQEVSTPQPKLTLALSQGIDPAIPGLLFSFVYGDLEIPVRNEIISEAVQTVMHNGKTYLLTRHAQQEKTAVARVAAMNLVAFEDLHDQHLFWTVQHSTSTELFNRWQQLIDHQLPQLEKEGWLIEIDPIYQLKTSAAQLDFTIKDSSNHWFEFSLAIHYGDYRLSTTDLVATWLEEGRPNQLVIPIEDEWVTLDTQPLQPIHDLLQALYKGKKLDQPVRLPAYQAAQLDALNLDDRKAPLTRKLIQQLKHFSGLEPVPVPEHLNATLRSYQQEGLNWLSFLHQYGFGGILADDMGLGKTLQSLALIQHLKNQKQLKKPVLVIAPTSLMGNWKREAEHFAPQLKTQVLHGAERHSQFNQIKTSYLIITSYPLIARDLKQHLKHTYALLILDEAQAIKNPRTQAAKNVREIKTACRICLTGTPLENHLGELWALMDFVLPGLLSGEKTFKELCSGLNLTQADTIIHLDPWWNPAVENQATDRAYRIGQDKPVFVYKLVATQTVEERIQAMQKEKQALADQLFDATGKTSAPQNKEDLLALLS